MITDFIPAGIPELAKESTSRDVKSGGVKVAFSKSEDHGSLGIIDGAVSTSFLLVYILALIWARDCRVEYSYKALVRSWLTIATTDV